jgi:uncharacterized OsmC-like protein
MTSMTDDNTIRISERQSPLRARYAEDPKQAWIVDSAGTSSNAVAAGHPLHGRVTLGTGRPVDLPFGVHEAVGGESDDSVPGEILAAAIASCLDSAVRMIANLMQIELARLEVAVDLGVDVRGTLQMDRSVPVGFQKIDIHVRMVGAADVDDAKLDRLLKAAERSCVLLQTLKKPPTLNVTRDDIAP